MVIILEQLHRIMNMIMEISAVDHQFESPARTGSFKKSAICFVKFLSIDFSDLNHPLSL